MVVQMPAVLVASQADQLLFDLINTRAASSACINMLPFMRAIDDDMISVE